MGLRHGGQVLADQLAILGGDRLFCVPGESFLGLLDGLHDHPQIDVLTCRHEGGAANMAEAHGKFTGRPGLCAVTRGPGATHAANGLHTAWQDSTPMILFVGQVGQGMRDREAFQEIDYSHMFGPMAKWVAEIREAARLPEYIARAWTLCQSGRPGPVVLVLPEDVLSAQVDVPDLRPAPPVSPGVAPGALDRLGALLDKARRPLLVVGGPGWSAAAAEAALAFARTQDLPVATSFRRQAHVDNRDPRYVGTLGIGPVPELRDAVAEACDLLIAAGPRLGEIASQGYTLLDIPNPQMPLVHIRPGADELGHVYAADLAIPATAEAVLAAAALLPRRGRRAPGWTETLRAAYDTFRQPLPSPGLLNMGEVIAHLDAVLPDDAVLTNGAGNYAVWLHRGFQYRGPTGQLAPTSGSMGYGLPAAIAAKRHAPKREVVCLAGDGCFLMTSQELATAARYGCAPIVMVVDNGMYGTIRMHQERHHPARVMATGLTNPDFVAYAASFGLPGERVTDTADFPPALARARASGQGYLLHLVVDPEALTPNQTLSAARTQGQNRAS